MGLSKTIARFVVVGLRLTPGPIIGKVLGPLNPSLGVKVLIVVICALFSVIVGGLAALLNHDPGAPKRKSVLFGGGVFGGTLTLAVLVLSTLRVL